MAERAIAGATTERAIVESSSGLGFARSSSWNGAPLDRVDAQHFEVPDVRRDHLSVFFDRLGGDDRVPIERVRVRADRAFVSRFGPQLCRPAPHGRQNGDVGQLSSQLVEVREAADRSEAQELSPQFVVGKLRDEKRVISHRPAEPGPHVLMTARMADLAEHPGVEEESHGEGERTPTRSTVLTSHSGSPSASSAAQRSNMAATRDARSTCGRILARRCSSAFSAADGLEDML